MITAFDTQQPIVSLHPYEDSWGRFISAYVPLFDEADEVYAVLGIDMQASIYQSQLAPIDRTFYQGLAAALLGSLLFSSILYRNRRRPPDEDRRALTGRKAP